MFDFLSSYRANNNSESLYYHDTECNDILGLMFCEFDNQEGPKIVYQKPYEIINKVAFDSISSYIIPKTQLKNRIITINVGKYRVCGFPIYIDHAKYHRNKYIFNISFIFNQDTNTCSYEALVKKLACDLKTLEVECGFLSIDRMKAHLPKLLEQIHSNLNSNGECIIQKIGNLEHSSLFLKLIKNHIDPKLAQSFDVPVFTINKDCFEIDDWDLATQKIVSGINGFKTISIIAIETNIEISIVKEAIQNLLYAGIIMLVPVIQYSSMFVLTSNIIQYYSDPEIHTDSINFVQLDNEKREPSFYDLFFFYSLFKNGITVQSINEIYHPFERNIDLKKLILFGLLKGFLKKIHKYPITLGSKDKLEDEKKRYTGIFNMDKICSSLGVGVRSVDEQLDEDKDVIVCIK